ncbi:quinone oxidoreductase family protein [Aureimonas sp. AU40]|uniref:quinone oxidoreductase family protein n=1 Tax=Aureimonas sp. AU40 TaxID=1637747 RepID=UPI0007867041|nr:quinone oxidoreductase [Aureimonas sp. AU40]
MTHAIVVDRIGGPDVLQWRPVERRALEPGEIRVRQEAIGLNFIDVYFRNGTYKAPQVPFVPGKEGAGVVIELGPEVADLRLGDRVTYCGVDGAYAEEIILPSAQALTLPDEIDCRTAAAMMLKGMTAEYLLRRTFEVGPGHTVLIHAAAGGVGLIAGQWAKHLGARVIGTAGSPEKCALALDHGYDHVIDYRREDFVAVVSELTGGAKCDVVYDSVGKDTFPSSLDCLKRRGLFVSFGQSSGKIEGFDVGILNQKGSLYLTRPNLNGYTATRAELQASAQALFEVVRSGAVKIRINQTFPLAEAAKAHETLEARGTTGASILTV